MAKKEIPSKYVYITIIAVTALFVGKSFIDNIKDDVAIVVSDEIANSPIGDVVTTYEKGKRIIEDTDFSLTESGNTINDAELYKVEFVRAKDGDTFVVKDSSNEITVRLIGVDTPESVAPASYDKENTEEGKKVSEIVKNTLQEGETLYLEFDVSEKDKYDRYLAYVYFEDGTMVQDWLLENGYAQTMTIKPDVKYAERFAEIEKKAKEGKKGFWNGFFNTEDTNLS